MNLGAYFDELLGGALIGCAASLTLVFSRRVAGVSGIAAGLLARSPERRWNAWFVAGLVLSGLCLWWLLPGAIGEPGPLALLIPAGLLVGFGTQLGSGCTSGHGVCGVSRLSTRSLVATALFVGTGMLTTWIVS